MCLHIYDIQVYKILALNCLVSAYLMSSLYLLGLKQGDTQMTALGHVFLHLAGKEEAGQEHVLLSFVEFGCCVLL